MMMKVQVLSIASTVRALDSQTLFKRHRYIMLLQAGAG